MQNVHVDGSFSVFYFKAYSAECKINKNLFFILFFYPDKNKPKYRPKKEINVLFL